MSELAQQYLIFIGLTFLLFSTANNLVWRFFESEVRGIFDWMILFFLFCLAEMLLVLGGAGFLNAFHLGGMAVGTVGCFLLGGIRWKFLGPSFQLGSFGAWNKLRQLFFRQEKGESKDWIWGIFGFLVVFGAVEFFNALVQFPWEYDTIAYHMPILVEWLQSKSLWDVFYAVWGGPLGYYPSNHELLLGWFVLPFGQDSLVNLFNFGVIAVMIVVIYKILKELEVDDFLAWLAGALVMVMPIFLRQMGTGQVDLLMALGVLIAWYYFLRTYKRKDGLLLIPLLINMAIMLGTKYLAVVYMIPIAVVFLFLAGYWRKATRWWWLWSILIMATLGGMWYWRNLVLTGNPLFPASVHIGDWVLFEGYTGLTERIRELSLWHRVTESGEWGEWLQAMVKETGWHLYLVLVAYALLVLEMMYKLLAGQMKKGEGKIYTLMLFFLPAYWYLYFIAPYTASMMEHNVRYAMPWLVLAMIMVVYVVYKLGASRKAFVIALMGLIWWQFLILVSAQRLGDQPFLELSYVYRFPWQFFSLFVVFLLVFLWFESWRRRHWWRWFLGLVVLVFGFSFYQSVLHVRSELRHDSWQHKYSFALMKAYEWIDTNVSADATIANSLNPLYYPLYGAELSRKVRYINVNGCADCDYFSYHEKGMTIRERADFSAWRENLRQAGVKYVVLGYSIQDGLESVQPYELEWAVQHPDDFQKVFEENGVFVYQFHG